MNRLNNDKKFLFIGALLAAAVFIFDLLSPSGIADGIPYVAIVLITLWVSGKKHTWYAGFFGTILTIAGYFLSQPGTVPISIILTNRFLAISGIWVAVLVILKYKKSYSEMVHNRKGLDALFYYATEGIIMVNERGEIIMINPQAGKLFGYEKEELRGKKIETLVPEKFRERHVQHRKGFHQNPHPRPMGGEDMALFGRRKDGSEFPVEISLTNYKTEAGMFVVAFIIDISLRKKQEDLIKKSIIELKQYSDELKASNAELENFAYISSHDLQEPLRKIQSFGERINAMEREKLSEQSKDYLDRVMKAAQRMRALINDLLAFSRLSSKPQQFEKIDLNQALRDVLSDLEIAIEKSRAKIEAADLPVIEGEPTQMRQLFQNLISNAIKFRKVDSIPVIKIHAQKNNSLSDKKSEYVDLIFEDNGIGFDEKYIDRIFNIFQRLEVQKYEGTGIGLAVCRKIAQRHGGDITAKSKIGEGATFIVTLAKTGFQEIITN